MSRKRFSALAPVMVASTMIAFVVCLPFLLVGCGSTAAPPSVTTNTPVAPSATRIAAEPTHTPLPPTALPALPTVPSVSTEAEPSATPTEISPVPSAVPTTRPGYFSRDQLIEDARQLAEAIESAHPDPYIRGGGKIAFHRRLRRLLNAIPEGGMTREKFIRLLRPFIAAVGDAHTELWSDYSVNRSMPGGVPLRFGIVEESLYVAGIPDEESRDLMGATLVSVEGVPLAELCERQRQQQGTENQYHALYLLATVSLWYRPYMEDLIPEWQDPGRVSVELQVPGGEIQEVAFDLPVDIDPMLTPASRVTLPATDRSGFLYEFLDAEGKTAYLRIDHMSNYREAREMGTGEPAPGLRSATETFRSMVVEMAQAGTEALIIDLRDNRGGHSVMGDILTYFLYGKETLQDIMVHGDAVGGGMVRKYSDLFWGATKSWTSLEQVNEGRAVPLRAGDYDFAGYSGDVAWTPARKAEAIAHSEEVWLARSPIFWEEYQSEAYGGHYCPANVVVLVDAETFSSGFNMAKYLYLAGATFVGTPSGQAANSWGNGQLWHLDHTGLEGTVSTTYSVEFADDSELAHVLPVHVPLTYEKLAAYDFDPNVEYLYALELLPQLGEAASLRGEMDTGPEPAEAPPEATVPASTGSGHRYGRDELIEDARQLADILESAHPDPYIRGGGKIAFHRRLHRLLNAIPEEGMTRDEFVRLLSPFIAAVGDGHTGIWDGYRVSDYSPRGVPLRFGIVEESLYVSGVPDEQDSDLIGALLVSVEGVPLAELCERQERLKGTENPYHGLQLLARLSLKYRAFMKDLLPEWEDSSRVRVELQLPSGEIQELVLELPVTMGSLHSPESSVTLPATDESGFLYDFVDAEGKTAYLRVDHMLHYREAYEIWALAGSRPSTEEGRAHIKSATETFRDLVVEMKEAGTETLIVDLRDNEGGHSLMADILLYFLYGKEDFVAVKTYTPAAGGGEIRRYSRLFFESCADESIEDFNEGRAVPLIEGDYSFDDDFTDDEEKVRNLFQESDIPAFLDRWISRSPTFYTEFQSGAYGGYYRPERIVVLVNPGTYSSGFTMARHLYLAGATLVGTPSAQASNCFGENIMWELEHTQVGGSVSDAYFNQFPDDPELGRVLPVYYPLSYDKLASYDFDPNAEYLYALELLSEHGESLGLAAKLDRAIERVFRQSDCPGLAVGVVKDQELVYAKGFGVVNLETGGEITPRTLFHMASVTKPFVATSIVQLLEQGKVSLDDRIVKYLPYFEMQDRRYDRLTIRQFLTHSSGMPDVDDYHWDEPEYDEGALERFVRSLTDRALVSVPGEKFTYSNMAFEVLGDLIAKVSGQSFADYVKEHILLPLGMNDSSILIRDVDPALLANGHILEEGGTIGVSEHYAYNRRHGPSSTLHSNVVDLSRWAIANMNRGELEGGRILDASSYELLWEPAVRVGVREGMATDVGLSWFLSSYAGYATVSHGGRDTGYQTNLVTVPEAGVAVIVLSNYSGPHTTVGDVTNLALDLALGSE